MDFVHGVSITGMKTMMEKQMEIYKNQDRREFLFGQIELTNINWCILGMDLVCIWHTFLYIQISDT